MSASSREVWDGLDLLSSVKGLKTTINIMIDSTKTLKEYRRPSHGESQLSQLLAISKSVMIDDRGHRSLYCFLSFIGLADFVGTERAYSYCSFPVFSVLLTDTYDSHQQKSEMIANVS